MHEPEDLLVVGADGSPASDRALEWALDEARRRRATVRVVTTFGPVQHGGTLDEPTAARHAREAAEHVQAEQLTRVAGPYREDVSLAAEVVEGRAVERLVDAARHARLLVVGSHGYGRLQQLLVGSVAAGCIRAAGCPVVVLPAPHLPTLEPQELQALGTSGYHPGPMY
jgi:nucleotide-binding universal stress UspA family protein